MFSSISSKTAATRPLGLSQQKKTAATQPSPASWQEIGTSPAATSPRSGRIEPRQNSASAKNLAGPSATKSTSAQSLVSKSLTNKTIATTAPNPLPPVQNKAADAGTPPAPTAPATPDPIEAVRALLAGLGYDTGRFKFESREEYVTFPGGGYTHKFTTVELPNGLKENFATDLMARFPAVTAGEIQRLMENRHLT